MSWLWDGLAVVALCLVVRWGVAMARRADGAVAEEDVSWP